MKVNLYEIVLWKWDAQNSRRKCSIPTFYLCVVMFSLIYQLEWIMWHLNIKLCVYVNIARRKKTRFNHGWSSRLLNIFRVSFFVLKNSWRCSQWRNKTIQKENHSFVLFVFFCSAIERKQISMLIIIELEFNIWIFKTVNRYCWNSKFFGYDIRCVFLSSLSSIYLSFIGNMLMVLVRISNRQTRLIPAYDFGYFYPYVLVGGQRYARQKIRIYSRSRWKLIY